MIINTCSVSGLEGLFITGQDAVQCVSGYDSDEAVPIPREPCRCCKSPSFWHLLLASRCAG